MLFRDELKAIRERIDRINQQAEKLDKRLGRKWDAAEKKTHEST